MKRQSGGLVLLRRITPLARRDAVYFCSGAYTLIQNRGAKDFYWKTRMVDIDRDEKGIDIHHIFPKKWCQDNDVPPRRFNSIVNKTAISYRANRKIGGRAPSDYLARIQGSKSVQLGDAGMDAILRTHCIDPSFLRVDDFEGFFTDRRTTLLNLVERAMGKQALNNGGAAPEDGAESEDED